MRIEILVDDVAPDGLTAARGFSALVDAGGKRILFDTGPSPETLVSGLMRSDTPLRSIDLLVLSHTHSDHTGGLSRVVYESPRIELSVPRRGASDVVKLCPRETVVIGDDMPRELAPGVHVTGDLGGDISEQALLIESSNGYVMLVGCGHPGLKTVLAAAQNEVRLLIGGMHDLEAEDVPIDGVVAFMACHCTPHKRSLAHRYEEVTVGSVGTIIEME